MDEAQKLQPEITDVSNGELSSEKDRPSSIKLLKLHQYKWRLRVACYSLFVLSGQSAATLLGRLYYDNGGNSKWMATFVQSAGFPLLFPFLFFFSSSSKSITNSMNSSSATKPKLSTFLLIYFSLGILLTVNADSENSSATSNGKYAVGFLCTIGASAIYSLCLSLVQLSFEKVIKKETFSAVLNMQIYPSFVATCGCILGLFTSGEWRSLENEMREYEKGKVSYLMTLIWTAIAWQISSVGLLGLIFETSSLFSNVISTLGLPIVPILAVIFFKDKIDGVKIIAMVFAIWGFVSYIYQHYFDDIKSKARAATVVEAAGALEMHC